jgi:hypothetical protein
MGQRATGPNGRGQRHGPAEGEAGPDRDLEDEETDEQPDRAPPAIRRRRSLRHPPTWVSVQRMVGGTSTMTRAKTTMSRAEEPWNTK